MRKILLGVGALLVLTSGLAVAGTIDLTWNACFSNLPASPAKASTKAVACNSNTGGQNLIVSFYPSAEITKLDAVDMFVDYHLTTGVPCWWDFRASNSLRAAALAVTSVDGFSCGASLDQSCFGCQGNYFTTVANASGGGGMALIDPTFGRISCTMGIPQGTGGVPATGQEEFGVSIRFTNANTLTCTGCLTPITLTCDHVTLFDSGSGANLQSTYTQAQHAAVTYFNLNPTAAEKKTWGAIKAIYRQ
jgi:hypothetical protein